MTWWQTLLVFWVYGTGARVDAILSQNKEFKYGSGLALRLLVWAAFVTGSWLLVDAWAGIAW